MSPGGERTHTLEKLALKGILPGGKNIPRKKVAATRPASVIKKRQNLEVSRKSLLNSIESLQTI
jgi:hypothetical protein